MLDTAQRHLTMPNKLFEYIGSGLGVLVSPAADMRALVEAYGVGIVSADAGPQAIAAAVNSLDMASVERFRAAAREAAKELCWETEREVFNAVHNSLGDPEYFSPPDSILNQSINSMTINVLVDAGGGKRQHE
jgi:hypothetical protein